MKTSVRLRPAIERLQAYVPGEQPREPGLVKLNTNENPYPPSPAVAAALAAFEPARLRLYPDPRCTALRARLADLHGCAPEQVFVGNGSDEVLALCVRAFVPRGGSVGWLEPSYSLYPVLAAIEELAARPVRLTDDFDWVQPAADAANLFVITHPNAPTGRVYPDGDVRAFCRDFRGVVVLDEAYVDFADRDYLDLAVRGDRVLVARTLSKSYSLAGLRLGYAVGPAPLIAALDKIKDSYNVDRLSQDLALAALSDRLYMQANVARIRATRERVAQALRARGFEVGPSQANFLWARPPGRPAADWLAALRARRILVRHFPGLRTGQHLRITVGADPEMDAFLEAVDAELRSAGRP